MKQVIRGGLNLRAAVNLLALRHRIPLGDRPLKLERYMRLAWPLRKDDTHKNSNNSFRNSLNEDDTIMPSVQTRGFLRAAEQTMPCW